jgi:hypothetical protein
MTCHPIDHELMTWAFQLDSLDSIGRVGCRRRLTASVDDSLLLHPDIQACIHHTPINRFGRHGTKLPTTTSLVFLTIPVSLQQHRVVFIFATSPF